MNWLCKDARLGLMLVLAFATTAMAEEKPSTEPSGSASPNTLTDADRKAGWRLLFDGQTSNGWRAFQGNAFPTVWKVADGSLLCTDRSKEQSKSRSDLVTIEEFDNFHLQLDWKIKAGGNGGVFFRVGEDVDKVWHAGPEIQLADDAAMQHVEKHRRNAACYGLYAAEPDAARPPGQWNRLSVIADGPNIEHWLNGVKVVSYTIGSEDWNRRVAASKFSDLETFAKRPRGHICLQDYGDEIAFRNIRIRPLSADESSEAFAQDHSTANAHWPQWRGPNRDGLSSEKGLLKDWNETPPELVWIGEGMGKGYAGVSIVDNHIYTTGDFDEGQSVLAIDAADGSVVWKTSVTDVAPQHGYPGARSTPSIDGDRLYVVASDGALVCLDRASGEIRWSSDLVEDCGAKMMSQWGFSESPLVDGPWVLCTPGGEDAMIVAFDKMTGDEVWRSAMPSIGKKGKDGAAYSSIVVSNAVGVKQYVQLVGRGVIGVRARDGKFLWGYNAVANTTANVPTPITSGDQVFCSTGYGAGAALLTLVADDDGVNAEEQYFLDGNVLQNHHGGMLQIGEHVYCGHKHNSGFPICVRLSDGEVAWGGDFRGPGSGSAAVVYADGNIIFRYEDGKVALIEATPDEYRLKGEFTPVFQQGKSWSHPVVAGGRLYLREQNKLMCYSLRVND